MTLQPYPAGLRQSHRRARLALRKAALPSDVLSSLKMFRATGSESNFKESPKRLSQRF